MAECAIDGCETSVFARGWCNKHYARWHRTGDPMAARPKAKDHQRCGVDGCEKPYEANGYCAMHRWRVRKHGDPGAVEMKKGRPPRRKVPCAVDGCDRMTRIGGAGLCSLHYERKRRTGAVGPPGPLVRAKGTGQIHDGYLRIMTPDGRRIMEHVYIMEQHLGRRLLPRENIHHRNGVTLDNRLENLELWVKPQPSGQRVADLVAWVVQYYPEDVARALSARRDRQKEQSDG